MHILCQVCEVGFLSESELLLNKCGHVLCNACRKCNLKCSCGAELTKTKILHLENFQDQQDLQLRQVLHQFQRDIKQETDSSVKLKDLSRSAESYQAISQNVELQLTGMVETFDDVTMRKEAAIKALMHKKEQSEKLEEEIEKKHRELTDLKRIG